MSKESFNETQYHIDKIEAKTNQIDEKLLLIEEEFTKSKNI